MTTALVDRACCDHCTLPLGSRIVASEVDDQARRFCCYGCLLAYQVTRASGEDGLASSIVIRLGLAIFFAMNVMMTSMPGYAPYLYGGDAAAFEGPLNQALRWLAMSFALPVLGLLGWPILRSFAEGGWSGGARADGLVLLGALSAFALSAYHTLIGSAAVYFDTAVMVLLFVTFGRYLEARTRADAGRAVRADLLATPARAVRIEDGLPVTVEVATLVPGDVVRVVAGEMFPTDGEVVDGEGSVDEALMTGESRLVIRQPGSAVAGGTCSVDGCFDVRVVRPAAESAAARIEQMLEAARRSVSPLEKMADRTAGRVLPATVAIAVVAGLWHAINSGIDAGVLSALSVLVVACPCALGIATPVALWFGVAAAARRGIILRDAGVLETASRVDRLFLDKTGTLTERTPRLASIEMAASAPWSAAELLRRSAALELGQHHPIARAIVAASGDLAPLSVRDVRIEPGRGIRGVVAGVPLEILASESPVRFGNQDRRSESISSPPLGDEIAVSLATPDNHVRVLSDGRLLAALHFAEDVRVDAVASIAELRDELYIGVAVLSGDSTAVALRDVSACGIEIATGLLPGEKLQRVATAATLARRRGGAVGFVGDGVNDAPALAAADVGIAFGEPADLPRITADALCLTDELRAIPWLLRHARRSVRVVRQNLALAFGYNSVAVALAAAGRLDPLIAATAMLCSSLLVVANARRVGRFPEEAAADREPVDRSRDAEAATVGPGAPAQGSWMPSSSSLR